MCEHIQDKSVYNDNKNTFDFPIFPFSVKNKIL